MDYHIIIIFIEICVIILLAILFSRSVRREDKAMTLLNNSVQQNQEILDSSRKLQHSVAGLFGKIFGPRGMLHEAAERNGMRYWFVPDENNVNFLIAKEGQDYKQAIDLGFYFTVPKQEEAKMAINLTEMLMDEVMIHFKRNMDFQATKKMLQEIDKILDQELLEKSESKSSNWETEGLAVDTPVIDWEKLKWDLGIKNTIVSKFVANGKRCRIVVKKIDDDNKTRYKYAAHIGVKLIGKGDTEFEAFAKSKAVEIINKKLAEY